MLELALRHEEGPVLLKEIAKAQEISEGYLEQILPPLKSAGLIHSSRGAHGGYALARNPAEITLREIVQSAEGSLTPVHCVDVPEVCSRSNFCVTRDIWALLRDRILETLESITLQDMVKRQKEKLAALNR